MNTVSAPTFNNTNAFVSDCTPFVCWSNNRRLHADFVSNVNIGIQIWRSWNTKSVTRVCL